jgi:ElaB/YqjD/DUF883 family membrane-anchored ribosome-binding protein
MLAHNADCRRTPMKPSRFDPSTVDLEFLKQEFNRFRDEVMGMKEKFGGNAAEILDQVSGYLGSYNVSSRLSSLEAELEALGAKLKDGGKDAVVKLEKEVSDRPLTSIAVAFGVGVLVSSYFRRK